MKNKVFSIELKTLPDRIAVRLPDRRGGNRVRSARIWNYVPERTCRIETVSRDARDWPENERCTECGEYVYVLQPPHYCPCCGARVVEYHESD